MGHPCPDTHKAPTARFVRRSLPGDIRSSDVRGHSQQVVDRLRHPSRALLVLGVTTLLVLAGVSAAIAAQTTSRVSTDSWGTPTAGMVTGCFISDAGRFVAFDSTAWSLVPGDDNEASDTFVKDLGSGAAHRVSVSTFGAQGNGNSRVRGVSKDGRYVLFASLATNLVDGDTNGQMDLFLVDRALSLTDRVNVSTSGTQSTGPVLPQTALSPDGKAVVFASPANNLVMGDTNGETDIFLRNMTNWTTNRISLGQSAEANGDSSWASVSDPAASSSGSRFVAFQSRATNLIDGQADTNGVDDIFVKQLSTFLLMRVSTVNGTAAQADGMSERPDISPDGKFVAFESDATNLVSGDTNAHRDIYLTDWLNSKTVRVSLSSSGAQPNADCNNARVSADGRFVAFESAAGNLVEGDTNGVVDIFLRDMLLRRTYRVSVSSGNAQGNYASVNADISADGRKVVYTSDSNTLVAEDYNSNLDAFLTVMPAPAVLLSAPAAPGTMYVNRTANVYATIKPRHAAATFPVRIYRYRKVSGAWKPYGYVNAKATNAGTTTEPSSKCSVALKLPYRGYWRLRAYAPADSIHAATWSSSYDYVTVK